MTDKKELSLEEEIQHLDNALLPTEPIDEKDCTDCKVIYDHIMFVYLKYGKKIYSTWLNSLNQDGDRYEKGKCVKCFYQDSKFINNNIKKEKSMPIYHNPTALTKDKKVIVYTSFYE